MIAVTIMVTMTETTVGGIIAGIGGTRISPSPWPSPRGERGFMPGGKGSMCVNRC